jgi:branched-chain amino acid transport system ATP-binding protein
MSAGRRTLLELKDLSCGYGPFRAVHGLSLTVERGQCFGLVGANGAGKTSTLMCLAGHVQRHGGTIELDGADISATAPRQRVRLGIAVVPEGRRLFPDLSVDENLAVGGYSLPASRQGPNRDRVFDLFPRLAERRGQRAGTLSGGEQQMLAIGRALMSEPRLLLVDEMSLGLMPKAIDLCYGALETLVREGMTTLVVEQNTDRIVAFADHLCVLESGRVVWLDDSSRAREDSGLIDAYLGLREEETA